MGLIVGSPDTIALTMSELSFDPVALIALLIEYSVCHRPESVEGHFIFGIDEKAQTL